MMVLVLFLLVWVAVRVPLSCRSAEMPRLKQHRSVYASIHSRACRYCCALPYYIYIYIYLLTQKEYSKRRASVVVAAPDCNKGSCDHSVNILNAVYRITSTHLHTILDTALRKYEQSRVEPGEVCSSQALIMIIFLLCVPLPVVT